ncbi:MAG: glycosyltransferase family 2 protein [Ignavibacteria bacterium]|nr:glycosyltransferase family 2 protein [Ignavibacteria bacterium]
MKISAVVITKNEERNIKECLETIKWADEIILIDSNSTDKTCEIASAYTDKILQTSSNVFSEKRIKSLNLVNNDWVLFVDADERLTKELINEILLLQPPSGIYGYTIKRRNYYFGKWIKHAGIYPDRQLRLFNKNYAHITPRKIHEGVEVNGEIGSLENDILHYSYIDMEQMISKINLYSSLEAQEKFDKQKQISKTGIFTHAISAFIRVYISRKGFIEGSGGFFVAFSYALVSFLSNLKLLKLQGKM